MRFKQWDVVTYSTDGEAIVSWEGNGVLHLVAWRSASNPLGWIFSRGQIVADTSKPHPEADRVRAEFCAWRLTQ